MRLADATSGNSVELNLAGYEFEQATNEYDANWLMVVGHIQHGSLSWDFRQPCLLTSEAQQLADWLQRVATELEPATEPATPQASSRATPISEPAEAVPSLEFLEPNLAFSLEGYSEPTAIETSARIRVQFAAEAAPRIGRDGEASATYAVVLQLTETELADAAAHWRRDLAATAETRQSDEQRHR